MAVNACEFPRGTDGAVGCTSIDTSIAVTVRTDAGLVTVPLAPGAAAVMFVLPCATPVACPVASMVAAAAFEEFHVAVAVMFCVVPSLRWAVAVNAITLPI